MAKEWYRKRSWTEADRADFFLRLRRASARNRSQYLRIQAETLLEENGLVLVAIELAELSLQSTVEVGEYDFEECLALGTLGRCHEVAGNLDEALKRYLEATQRMSPGAQTTDWLRYVWLVARSRRSGLYSTARELIARFAPPGGQVLFAVDLFRIAGSEAMMLADSGQRDAARGYADRALAAVEITHSGFSRHPSVGLVGDVNPQVIQRLSRISAGSADTPDGQRPQGMPSIFRRH